MAQVRVLINSYAAVVLASILRPQVHSMSRHFLHCPFEPACHCVVREGLLQKHRDKDTRGLRRCEPWLAVSSRPVQAACCRPLRILEAGNGNQPLSRRFGSFWLAQHSSVEGMRRSRVPSLDSSCWCWADNAFVCQIPLPLCVVSLHIMRVGPIVSAGHFWSGRPGQHTGRIQAPQQGVTEALSLSSRAAAGLRRVSMGKRPGVGLTYTSTQ